MLIFINLSGTLSKLRNLLAEASPPCDDLRDEKGAVVVDQNGTPKPDHSRPRVDLQLFERARQYVARELAALDAEAVKFVGVCCALRPNVDGGREIMVSISEHAADPTVG